MNTLRRCKPLLGTYVEISVEGERSADALLELSTLAFIAIETVDRLMSFQRDDSELTRVNRSAHREPCAVSAELAEVLRQALALSELSAGVFDITIAPELVRRGALPDTGLPVDQRARWTDITLDDRVVRFDKPLLMDLGGIAKGYAVDRAMAIFDDDIAAVVNAGGDLSMSCWNGKTVAIRHSLAGQAGITDLAMQAPALASTAGYYAEQGSVIISPLTRSAVEDERTFAVFAPNCMLADALTKVAILAPERSDLIRSLGGIPLAVDRAGSVTYL